MITLFQHQQQALDQTEGHNRCAYYLDMGLGKTFVGSEDWNTYNSPPFSLDCTKKFYKIKWGCLIMADVKQCDMCLNIFKKEEVAIIENMEINCILFGTRDANENSYSAKKLFDLCPDCAESLYQIIQKWPKQLEKEREKE